MKTNVISRILDVQEFISRYDFKNKYNELQIERLRLCHDIQQQSSNEINYKLFHDVEVDLNIVQNILSDIDYINEISDILDDSLSSTEIDQILKSVEDIKQHIFNYLYNIYHNNNMECDGAIISLNAGSGGVEAEDWTGMILRMYLMWCKKRNISHDIISTMYSADAPNGIKSCELLLNNKMAYELLNKETGVHRLVRMSPFSKSKSRHTSFCAVRVIPNQKDAINIVINEAQDVRIDVMRGHGAGGQHRNKTDSAVRITHLKTGVIAYCQSDRSQHRNKENAFKILRNRLYEIEQNKRNLHKQEVNKNLTDISWGNQIRSYILHPEQRIKDHRTNYTEHDFNYVLDGNLDSFIYSFI